MKLKRIFVTLLLCTGMYTATAVVADTRPALTPVPSELVMQQGEFVWKDNTSLWIDAPQADKQILTDYLQASGLKLKAARKEASKQQGSTAPSFLPSPSRTSRVSRTGE